MECGGRPLLIEARTAGVGPPAIVEGPLALQASKRPRRAASGLAKAKIVPSDVIYNMNDAPWHMGATSSVGRESAIGQALAGQSPRPARTPVGRPGLAIADRASFDAAVVAVETARRRRPTAVAAVTGISEMVVGRLTQVAAIIAPHGAMRPRPVKGRRRPCLAKASAQLRLPRVGVTRPYISLVGI